jgi:hypothetical protein
MGRPCSSDGGGDMEEYIPSTALFNFLNYVLIQWNDAMIGESWTGRDLEKKTIVV